MNQDNYTFSLIFSQSELWNPYNPIFYCNSYFIPPDEVIINNVKKNNVNYEYDFINDINNVILIWNEPIKYLQHIFYKYSNITEVDLSHLNSSLLENTGGMFQLCSS